MRSMMRGCCTLFLAAAALGGFAGCAAHPAASSPVSTSATESTAAVPSGLAFHAHLDRALSSTSVKVGEHFTATTEEPLRGSDGSVRVARGTKLMGRVIGVDRAEARITIQFDGLYLDGHVQPIAVRIVGIEGARVVGADAPSTSGDSDATEPSSPIAFVYRMAPVASTSSLAVGGGPPSEETPLEVAPGAQFLLMLSRPFTPAAAVEAKPQSQEEHQDPRIEGR